jgi:hypothetical protein
MSDTTESTEDRPERHLLKGDLSAAVDILDLFTKLTGREPTPEEVGEVMAELSE